MKMISPNLTAARWTTQAYRLVGGDDDCGKARGQFHQGVALARQLEEAKPPARWIRSTTTTPRII